MEAHEFAQTLLVSAAETNTTLEEIFRDLPKPILLVCPAAPKLSIATVVAADLGLSLHAVIEAISAAGVGHGHDQAFVVTPSTLFESDDIRDVSLSREVKELTLEHTKGFLILDVRLTGVSYHYLSIDGSCEPLPSLELADPALISKILLEPEDTP